MTMNIQLTLNETEKQALLSVIKQLKISVGLFKDKTSGQLGAMVDSVGSHHYVYNASEWEKVNSIEVEGIDRIESAIAELWAKSLKIKGE